jgi:hypothetical protein
MIRAVLALAHRASAALRRALAWPLLAGVYVVAGPALWAWLRLRTRRPTGWIGRGDADAGRLDRLRLPF